MKDYIKFSLFIIMPEDDDDEPPVPPGNSSERGYDSQHRFYALYQRLRLITS